MTDRTQPEAREFTMSQYASKDDMIGAMRKRIAELESELEAVGAGGVSGPLMGQPQAMPDLSQLTERGAKAWAGVDAQGLREGFTAADMATASAQGDALDAARYRFLRDGEWRDTDLEPFIRLQLNTMWDAKIDAARKQEPDGRLPCGH